MKRSKARPVFKPLFTGFQKKTKNKVIVLNMSLDELYVGVPAKVVSFVRKVTCSRCRGNSCGYCNDSGTVMNKKCVTFEIPKGTLDGS